MKYAYDIHIHSVLSPCADVLMTPNNIFNMAKLKNLDIIAVTDHNSLKQVEVCYELSKSYDMLFIPGVEVTVKENFDVLCYFKKIEDAIQFDHLIEKFIPKVGLDNPNFKEQEIMDINDDIVGLYPYALSEPLELSIHELHELLSPFEHIVILAHIDRTHRSGKAFMNDFNYEGIELVNLNHKNEYAHIKHILHSSDAHQITDLLEKTKDNMISLDQLDIDSFFRYFKHD